MVVFNKCRRDLDTILVVLSSHIIKWCSQTWKSTDLMCVCVVRSKKKLQYHVLMGLSKRLLYFYRPDRGTRPSSRSEGDCRPRGYYIVRSIVRAPGTIVPVSATNGYYSWTMLARAIFARAVVTVPGPHEVVTVVSSLPGGVVMLCAAGVVSSVVRGAAGVVSM